MWSWAYAGCLLLQVVRDLLVWAADATRLLDEGGASPMDLAMQADADNVIKIFNSLSNR